MIALFISNSVISANDFKIINKLIFIILQSISFLYFYFKIKTQKMSNTYKLTVNNSYEFDLNEDDLKKLDAVPVEKNNFHVLKGHKPYKATIVSADFNAKTYTIKINNNSYEVTIADGLDLLIKSMGIARGSTKVINAIKAPMPGLILEISVSVGQEVKENDLLLILEAMKMENSFLSPRDGVIKSIAVTQGNAVDKGQLLIEFE